MKLSSLFSDHAVLQHGISVPVWGMTKPRLKVQATLAGLTAGTLASPSGFFMLRLPPLPVGGPYTLTITTDDPTELARVQDVLVGEVWVCSGQSNMEFMLASGNPDPEPCDCPAIRMITVPKSAPLGRQTEFSADWRIATRENAQSFSSVGFFFAKRLHNELKIPVGMIHSSWGGTRAEAWTSRESLIESPVTAQMVKEYEANLARAEYWESNGEALSRFPLDPGNVGVKQGWAKPDFNDSAWKTVNVPASFEQCQSPKTNGSFWFRKTIKLPSSWIGKELVLRVGSADKHDVTYFNGVEVGATGKGIEEDFWSLIRKYPVSASTNNAEIATVAVRVWSFAFDGGLRGPAHEMRIELANQPSESIRLAGDWKVQIEHDIGLTPPPPAAPYLPGNPNCPNTLFDGMISPLLPYGIRGAIWYQGESNANAARDYLSAQVNMIEDWRHAWGQGNFPFISVQLANFSPAREYDSASSWAIIREAQLQTTKICPNTGMASAIDIGEALDIHPKNKRDVGHRLAQWALAKTYNRKLVANGPHYADYSIEGSRIRIRFTDIGSGLLIKDPNGKIKTCYIADESRKFVPAEAVIDGDTLVVSAAEVKAPMAVRYAWADNPEGCNLYNAEGLPASPFRTDAW